jgi:hypothetical protein
VGVEELVVGVEDDEDPVVPESDVVPDEVLVVDEESDEEDFVEDEVAVDPDDDEGLESDVAAAPAACVPGRSWATTTPITTVAPAAATTAPRVSVRNRDLARSRSAGELCWKASDIWWVLRWRRPHPTMANSTLTQGTLWSSCDSGRGGHGPAIVLPRYDARARHASPDKGRRWLRSTPCGVRSTGGTWGGP